MTVPLTPALGPMEIRLLTSSARTRTDSSRRAEIRALLDQPLDWEAILFHTRLHSTASLLYNHLAGLDRWELLPDRVRRELLRLYHRAAYQNRIYASENRCLLEEFRDAGIPVIVHKGISLVELIYGSLALRPLIDLVFLVPRRHIPDAERVLVQRGYRERSMRPVEAAWRWCCPQRSFARKQEMRVTVLLQWDPVNWPRIHALEPGPLWERSRPAMVSGRPARVLSPVDQVLFLCLQADNHGVFNRAELSSTGADDLLFAEWSNNRLVRFCDLYEVLRSVGDEMDWAEFVERARASVIEEPVHASLTLTNDLLGPVVESAVLESLRARRRHRVARWVRRAVAPGDHQERAPSAAARAGGAVWEHLPPRTRVKLVYFMHLAEYCFPPPARLRRSRPDYPAPILPLVYFPRAAFCVARALLAYLAKWLQRAPRRLVGRSRAAVAKIARSAAGFAGRAGVSTGG